MATHRNRKILLNQKSKSAVLQKLLKLCHKSNSMQGQLINPNCLSDKTFIDISSFIVNFYLISLLKVFGLSVDPIKQRQNNSANLQFTHCFHCRKAVRQLIYNSLLLIGKYTNFYNFFVLIFNKKVRVVHQRFKKKIYILLLKKSSHNLE